MLLLFFEIDFDSRKEGGSWNDCLMSIDGTDFRILQKGAMARGNKSASHKYGGKSALRDELGLDILRGNLVWIEGPYAAGKYPDITIFRNCLKNFLDPNERVVADKGYVGEAQAFELWQDGGSVTVERQTFSSREGRAIEGLACTLNITLHGDIL